MGPYERCKPRLNTVRFTPVQLEAIRSGVNHGLTMVVGPPGTGKTDTAVQMINLIYHNFPDQKMLLVAHSNQALNDLFEKIIALDIPERYLLRMGHSAKDLDTDKDFSKWGRVNYMLQRRLDKLTEVERLATSLGVHGMDVSYTCENASHFFLLHVTARWEEFQTKLRASGRDGSGLAKLLPRARRRLPQKGPKAKRAQKNGEEMEVEEEEVVDAPKGDLTWEELEPEVRAQRLLAKGSIVEALFPFAKFFSDAAPLFTGNYDADLEVANGCHRYLQNLLQEVEECHAF